MRFGFIGNTNNYPLLLALALKDQGHEVRFVLDSEAPLHHPSGRFPEWGSRLPEWILDLSPMDQGDFRHGTKKRRQALAFLGPCDAVFLNFWGPSLHQWIGAPMFAFLTGADLTFCANSATLGELQAQVHRFPAGLRRLKGAWEFGRLVQRQRAGIRAAKAFCYQYPGLDPVGEAILDSIGMDGARRISIYITDTVRLRPAPPPPRRGRLRAVCGARLNWKHPFPETMSCLDDKGTDNLVRGLGTLKRHSGLDLELLLIRKGLHVQETMELVASEDLVENVVWRDELTQTELWDEYRRADLVFEQLGPAALGMAGMDALALGRPLVARLPEAQIQSMGADTSPVFQASDPGSVALQVERLLRDEALRHHAGLASRRFAETHLSAHHAADDCLSALGLRGLLCP